MAQEPLRGARYAPDTSASEGRTSGLDAETQGLLDEIYKGADASAAKEYLNKYIWVAIWGHVQALCKCEPRLENLLEHRAALKSCMNLAHDLNLRIINTQAASDKLRELYHTRKIA